MPVSDIVAAFAVTAAPIDYQSLDEQPVRLVFLLVGKDSMVGPHNQTAEPHLAPDEQGRVSKKLLAAASPKEVLEIFRTEEAMYFDN